MTTSKRFVLLIAWALLIWTLAGCASTPPAVPTIPAVPDQPTAVSTTTTAPTEAQKFGYITGKVHLAAPPTPAMFVYAIDPATGRWASTETLATDGEATFTLTVPPGSYQVFAFSEYPAAAVYAQDTWTLGQVKVAENQTIADITVRPPTGNDCGGMFYIPASPDGRFEAIPGPSPDCIAAAEASAGQPDPGVLPIDTPPGFEQLYGLGHNIILPPAFPTGEGLPAVQPYILSAESGDYDISLDFGPECQGAGACHYGSLSSKKVAGSQPESTVNFIYDPARAQKVTLAKNIEGYYLEGQCGASCDDSKIFWIYNGFQYMIGIKGATQQTVVDLVSAAINNSIH